MADATTTSVTDRVAAALNGSRQAIVNEAEKVRLEFHERYADLGFYFILGNAKGQWVSRGTFSKEMTIQVLKEALAQLEGPGQIIN